MYPESFVFFHNSPETSKRARALPFYLALRRHGSARIGRNVHHLVRVCVQSHTTGAEHAEGLVEEILRLAMENDRGS